MAIRRLHEAPPPGPGAEIWLEGLAIGPLPSVVIASRDDLLALDPPRVSGRPVKLPDGRTVELVYTVRKVPCSVSVILGADGGGEPGLWARMTTRPIRNQRRDDVRVDDQLGVAVRVREDSTRDVPDRLLRSMTYDLAARGVGLASPEPIEVDALLDVEIDLPDDDDPVPAIGAVVRAVAPTNRTELWRIGIALREIEPDDERRLRGRVLARQRHLRRRELGLD